MPVIPKASLDAYRVGKVHGKHSGWSPTVDGPGIRRIASVREPDGREMRPAIICQHLLGLNANKELYPPLFLSNCRQKVSYRNWEICDSCLCVGYRRRLIGTTLAVVNWFTPIRFHGLSGCCRTLGVRNNTHSCGKTGMVEP